MNSTESNAIRPKVIPSDIFRPKLFVGESTLRSPFVKAYNRSRPKRIVKPGIIRKNRRTRGTTFLKNSPEAGGVKLARAGAMINANMMPPPSHAIAKKM